MKKTTKSNEVELKEAEVEHWALVLHPDGIVESVEGGAPTTWIGRVLTEEAEAPKLLRDAARLLMQGSRSFVTSSYLRRQKVRSVDHDKPIEVELILVEALPLRRSPTRVGELIMRTLESFVSQATACDVDLRVEHSVASPPALIVDGEKIAWALATLVGNALRYVESKKSGKGHVVVRVDWDEATTELVIAVKDNGPGMPPDRARWLFGRDPMTGQSAGLALLMVQDVVAAHRGTIAAESSLGHGTTFTLRFKSLTTA